MRVVATTAMLVLASCGRVAFDAAGEDVPPICASEPTSAVALGRGTAADPFLLCNATQWVDLAQQSDSFGAQFKLVADIDLSTIPGDHPSIGTATLPFAGVLDGNHQIVTNYRNHTETFYVGLFGVVDGSNAMIQDLAAKDADLDAGEMSGPLVGLLIRGTVRRCAAFGSNCHSGSALYANHRSGLIGESRAGGVVIDAFSTCRVDGAGGGIAGLVGHNEGTVINAYYANVVGVESASRVGGLAGWHVLNATITDSFSAAKITANGDEKAGALIGTDDGAVTSSFYDTDFTVTNLGSGGTSASGTGVSGATGYFYSANHPPMSAWDFTTVWLARPDDFPILRWLDGK